jgi:hypothetical protein
MSEHGEGGSRVGMPSLDENRGTFAATRDEDGSLFAGKDL